MTDLKLIRKSDVARCLRSLDCSLGKDVKLPVINLTEIIEKMMDNHYGSLWEKYRQALSDLLERLGESNERIS